MRYKFATADALVLSKMDHTCVGSWSDMTSALVETNSTTQRELTDVRSLLAVSVAILSHDAAFSSRHYFLGRTVISSRLHQDHDAIAIWEIYETASM